MEAQELLEDSQPLSLTSLEVANVLRLKAVKLKLEGDALIIEGGNEQGKSSVLRSLEILLAGMSKTASEPLHGDSKKGHIIAKFGGLVVRKSFSKGKSPSLTIKSEKKAVTSPQRILNTLLDHVALNPLQFMEATDKEKLATLSDVMGFDSSAYDTEHERLYAARRDANRDVKRLRAQLDGMPCDETAPKTEVNVADLMAELETIDDANSEFDALQASCSTLSANSAGLKQRLHELREQIKQTEADIAETDAEWTATSKMRETRSRVDTLPIRQKIASADAINAAVRAKAQRAEIADELLKAEESASDTDEKLREVEAAREQARLAARENLPLEDLDITEDAVLYKGKPLSQAGDSAQLRVSVAVAMGLNKDKRIKLLLIDNAEKLDPKNTAVVLEMAAKAGFQVLMTRVGTGSEGSVVIEDGTLEA